MTALRRVDVYPALLVPDRPWHPDRGADAFLRSARSVCEVMTDALVAAPALATSTTLLRLWIDEDEAVPATGPVSVHVPEEERRPPRGSWEGARVLVPSDVADLHPHERRRLVLDVLEHVLRRVAPHRGWASETVDQVVDRALRWHEDESGAASGPAGPGEPLVYRWASPWRASPDRRHAARAVYRIADDGFGRARLQVRRRDDDALVAESQEDRAFHTREGLRRSARTLRWDGAARVRLDPYSAPHVQVEGELDLDLRRPPSTADGAATTPADHRTATARPGVVGATAPGSGDTGPGGQPWATWVMDIDAIGHDVRPVYDWAWDRHLLAMAHDTAWRTWWAPAKRPHLELRGWLTWAPPAPRISYTRDAVRLTYPVHVGRLQSDDRDELARRARTDLGRAVTMLSSKLGLGATPPLPPAPPVPADIPDAYERHAPTPAEMRAFAAAAGVDGAVLDELWGGDAYGDPDEGRTPYVPY